jgi:hypothetical protein
MRSLAFQVTGEPRGTSMAGGRIGASDEHIMAKVARLNRPAAQENAEDACAAVPAPLMRH